MTNPQDNPGTPPQPTPSDSSTSHPPSTTPKLRRVKMLARKIVASGALSRKLNEQLKAIQTQDSDSNSNFESYNLLVKGKDLENVEESGKKLGGSGSGEATEGLVNLSSQGDEPGSSTEETLADLLKRVGASYDPKRRRFPTPKSSSAPKLSIKRKASSPTTTETSLPKGRATRSTVKRSESDLQKALAESKKKRIAKGKGKVAESSEAIDIEEM
uniref:Flocculation protein FLO11-like n=1 Tax=Nicotiana sylvestris TaxID=4096 RepID=A0A1U7XF06_NICSY|nr:PREDICTED: flocculation protein FLO11-like [Nicotiana sylvestris]